jgi:hypothetical protein
MGSLLRKARPVTSKAAGQQSKPASLYSRWLDGEEFAINGGCDSFYEYLLKLWLQGGRHDNQLWEAYIKAVRGIQSQLITRCLHPLSLPCTAPRGFLR